MEQAVQFVAGVGFLILGLSWLFRAQDWAVWFRHIQQEDRRKALSIGTAGLIVSAMIVGAHPVWTGIPLLLTLVGVAGILESTLYLMFPGALPRILSWYGPRYQGALMFFGFLMIFFGSLILYGWWQP